MTERKYGRPLRITARDRRHWRKTYRKIEQDRTAREADRELKRRKHHAA